MKGDLTEQRLSRPAESVWRGYVEEWDTPPRTLPRQITDVGYRRTQQTGNV